MDKRTAHFVILYIIVEILLILGGLIYVYIEGSCVPGSVCRDASEVLLEGFVFPIIFGILAPILFWVIRKRRYQKK
jgi:hypothetical protein